MNKTSEETFSFPSASHTTHLYDSLHCGQNKLNEQTAKESIPNEHNVFQIVDGFNSHFNNNLMGCESLKYPQMHDGINSNITHFISERHLEDITYKSDINDNEEKKVISDDLNEKYSVSGVDSNCNDDSIIIVQESACNGTMSRPSSNSTLPSPVSKYDSSMDANGCTKSISLPGFEGDRVKMNLEKLDETIDYVLAFARSDEPCEDMFVLSCRMRDPGHISSPNARANTPSSGFVASPALSPAPSPHSNQVSISMMAQTPKTQSSLQSSNLCSMISSQPLQRYMVDPTHRLLHLSSNASCQYAPTQYTNQTVSFVQICSDTSNNSVIQCPQPHLLSQLTQPLNSHVVFHPGVIRNIQNHNAQRASFAVPQTALPAASVQRIHTPLLSPSKVTVCNQTLNPSDECTSTHLSVDQTADTQQKLESSLPLTQSNICVLRSPVQSSQSVLYGTISTAITDGCINDSKQTSFVNDEKKHGSTTFRQPIIPAQSASNSVLTVHALKNQTNSSVLHNDQAIVGNQSTNISKKRPSSTVAANNKRRKTSVSTVSSTSATNTLTTKNVFDSNTNANRLGQSVAQQCLEKLRNIDVKSLVSAPTLQHYTSVLTPTLTSECKSFFDVDDEDAFIYQKGLKYTRGALAVGFPLCLFSCNVDDYLNQHLKENVPSGPMIHSKSYRSHSCVSDPVRASPEPLSFENNMMTLFSKIHQCSDKDEKNYRSKSPINPIKLSVDTNAPQTLLNMFSQSPPCSSGKLDVDRCTPPLPLQHMPNPRLLYQLRQPISDREKQSLEVKMFNDEKVFNPTIKYEPTVNQSTVSNSINGSSFEICNGYSDSSSLVDSETGEALPCRNTNSPCLSNNSEFNLTENEKLHITFTINPSTTVSIPKIIRRITELLGIEKDSVVCQITRSGAQITLDQKQQQSEFVMRSLETHLRQQFTPLSLHFEKESMHQSNFDYHNVNGVCTSNKESPVSIANPVYTSRLNKIEYNFSPKPESTAECETQRYPEEPVSLISLLANRHRTVNKVCRNCDKLVPPYLTQRKWLEELANVSGISMRSESSSEFSFCSNDCLMSYSRLLNCSKYSDTSVLQTPEMRANNVETNKPLIVCDLPCSVPVLLQNCPLKSKSVNLKRQYSSQLSGIANKRRAINTSVMAKHRKWRGVRWKSFSAESNQFRITKASSDVVAQSVYTDSHLLKVYCSSDTRVCVLCSLTGDGAVDGVGQLLPLDLDRWVHVNCALWCFEVYETVGGSLNNVEVYLDKAMETVCSHCETIGAGLPCYNPKCSFVYHVPCAIETGCMFFTDRGMYCSQHQPKEVHPMQLPTLSVNRRVYVTRDENSQIAQVVHEEDRSHVVRLGSVCLHAIGQLLPHQIDSGYFHTRRNIYPVGLCTSRIYWSMRRPLHRAKYICRIMEQNNRPLFQVTCIDVGMEDEVLTHEACDGVWQIILSRVESLRKDNKLVRVFPQYLKGEYLYGLGERHIIRTIESLPGVDGLRDYVFNFGRLELISEMPLAINPSGCARSEPKMQTYVKRFKSDATDCSSNVTHRSSSFPGIRKLLYPGSSVNAHSITDGLVSKQFQNSRSQQYRRLKAEVNINVILGRSRIQGLGLFAARDLEEQTMVIEYIGELIRSELANKREKKYEAHNKGIYMFRLNEDIVIDATVCGGLARYVNHSCQPNCCAEYISFVDHSHIVIITNRRIKKGEELCYDYNFDMDDRGDKIPCLCGASNCRKWMN